MLRRADQVYWHFRDPAEEARRHREVHDEIQSQITGHGDILRAQAASRRDVAAMMEFADLRDNVLAEADDLERRAAAADAEQETLRNAPPEISEPLWEFGKFSGDSYVRVPPGEYEAMDATQAQEPVRIPQTNYWWFQDAFYLADSDLESSDVAALVQARERKRRRSLEKAHAVAAMEGHLDPKGKRQPIAGDVKLHVWQRDHGRCVDCGANEDLEYDHIIPLAMGGANTERNLQLLCASCNRRKGASLS